MKYDIKHIVTVFISCALFGCAGTSEQQRSEPGSRGDCIPGPSIRGYSVLDERNLIVDAGRRSYHLVLQRRALGLNNSWAIAFDSRTSRVCAGFDSLLFDGRMDGESIRIDSIRELTAEDKEDLLIRFGKKAPEVEYAPPPQEVKGADVEELDPDDSE